MLKIIEGNLITLAENGEFGVIAHGCNCFCNMGAGIAPQIAKAFPEAEVVDNKTIPGDVRKLGLFTSAKHKLKDGNELFIINAYSQFMPGRPRTGNTIPLEYPALANIFVSLNQLFKGEKLGLPWIGCGLAGGDKEVVKKMIETLLVDIDVTIVEYKP